MLLIFCTDYSAGLIAGFLPAQALEVSHVIYEEMMEKSRRDSSLL